MSAEKGRGRSQTKEKVSWHAFFRILLMRALSVCAYLQLSPAPPLNHYRHVTFVVCVCSCASEYLLDARALRTRTFLSVFRFWLLLLPPSPSSPPFLFVVARESELCPK